jgi:hypothetical protein
MSNKLNDLHWENDYDRLVELMKDQSVVCSIDFLRQGHEPQRDIAIATFSPRNRAYRLGVRGHRYFSAPTAAKFKSECSKFNVRYLLPRLPRSKAGNPAGLVDVELSKAEEFLDRLKVGTDWQTKDGMSPDDRFCQVSMSIGFDDGKKIFDFSGLTVDGESAVEWTLGDCPADFFRGQHDSWDLVYTA